MSVVAATFVKPVRSARRLSAQAAGLRAFGPRRAASVLDVRIDAGELVLERVRPGVPLAEAATEEEAMRIVARLFADGWPAPPPDSAPVMELLAIFAHALDAADARFARAGGLLRELAADERDAVLLHGDLHYGNVLSSDRAGWLLIDPAGVIGPREFDIGYLVSRPMPAARDRLPLRHAIDRRLGFLPDALQLDRDRVAAFAYVAAALSLAWSIEDEDPGARAFAVAMSILERAAA